MKNIENDKKVAANMISDQKLENVNGGTEPAPEPAPEPGVYSLFCQGCGFKTSAYYRGDGHLYCVNGHKLQ
ncbi:MAG: hypothetical protein IJH09_06665 [Clostridia bacterium]|nr:hypothetical protein [Clostridia bacterium]